MDVTSTPVPSNPVIFFIFGATGDLTSRKLIPALYNLFLQKWMPDNFAIIGMGRTAYTDENFRQLLAEKLENASGKEDANNDQLNEFKRHIYYQSSEISDDNTYLAQADWIRKLKKEWESDPCLIYYMAVAPRFFGTIAEKLAKHKLTAHTDRSRVVIEKPFGHDLESARALNRLLNSVFSEEQIYRIDHYLGKEAVQNILDFCRWRECWKIMISMQTLRASQSGERCIMAGIASRSKQIRHRKIPTGTVWSNHNA